MQALPADAHIDLKGFFLIASIAVCLVVDFPLLWLLLAPLDQLDAAVDLDEWGLEAALGQRVNELNAGGPRQIHLQVMGGSKERLPRDLEVAFFHVAREALNNVVHHSRSSCTQVLLRREADWLTLEVQDDGVGFEPNVLLAQGIACELTKVIVTPVFGRQQILHIFSKICPIFPNVDFSLAVSHNPE